MSAEIEGAKKLGEKLRSEVEVDDLSSLLKALRDLQASRIRSPDDEVSTISTHFNINQLDSFLPSYSLPVIELISPPAPHHPSGTGRTSLLYLIIAHAILPSSISSIVPLPGLSSVVVLFDPRSNFSTSRLVQVMLSLITTSVTSYSLPIDEALTTEIKQVIARSLQHLHIFRPQSWESLLITLRTLPDYLFDFSKHKSTHRRLHSVILDDVDAFAWSIKSKNSSTSILGSNPLTDASVLLTSALNRLSAQFSCSVVTTSSSASASSWRSVFPVAWPQGVQVTKLAVKRLEVLKFTPAISMEEAEAEREQRWNVAQKGRFECWKIGVSDRGSAAFGFTVTRSRVEVEEVASQAD